MRSVRSVRWVGAAVTALLLGALVPAAGSTAQAATAPVTTGSGASYGGPGHSFSVPAGAPGGNLVRLWTKTVSGPLITPLIVGSAVVTATRSSGAGGNWSDLQAFDGATGKPLWPPLAVGSRVASLGSDGRRIFALADQNVLAVDLASGRVLWSMHFAYYSLFSDEMPAVSGGLLWVNSNSSSVGLVGLDPATGAVVHSYPAIRSQATMALVGHTLYDSACAYDLPSAASLPSAGGGDCDALDGVTQSDGTVVVSPAYNDPTHLAVVDAALTRGRLWSPPAGMVALDGGRLFVATARKQFTLASYDETTGAPHWSITLPARPAAPPIVFGGTAAVATTDGHLRRYSTATGALVQDTTLAGRPIYDFVYPNAAPAADSGLLAVPGGKSLTVFRGSTTGTPAALRPAAHHQVPVPARATGLDHADGSQYAQDAGHDGVAAGSTLTGPLHLAWSKTLPGAVSNAIVDGTGRMFVAAEDPAGGLDVYRLDRRSGAVLWGPVRLTGGINLTQARLALSGGMLVDYEIGPHDGGGSSGLLHGLDPATGAVRWTTALPPAVYGYDGYPMISGGIIYVHNQDDRVGGVVYAFDLATGKPAWASIVMQAYDTLGPVAGGGLVYVSGITNQLYALDPASGRQAYWANSGADGGGTSSAVYAGGRLYVNDFPGGGQVFSAPTGAPAGAGMFATRRPSVDPAANVMVALQGNRITAESLTDRTRYWTVTDKSIPSLSPIIANGMVITGDNSGRLLVLDEATGTQVWSDAHAFAPTTVSVVEGTEPARLTVGAGGLAVTSGNQVRLYAGAVDNGPRTG